MMSLLRQLVCVFSAIQPRKLLRHRDDCARDDAPVEVSTIRAIMAAKPSTPAELVRAARSLVQLGHPGPAKPFVQQLAAMQLEDEVYSQLIDEVGSATLINLARQTELNPEASKFCDAAQAGAARYARRRRAPG